MLAIIAFLMSESLTVEVDSFAGVALVRLRGALVFGENLKVIHDIVTRLTNEGHDRLIVDLTDVESTDSSGITALLDVKQLMVHMILLRPPERLRSALAVTRVTSLFEVVDDETQLSRCLEELPDHTDAHDGDQR